MDVNIKLVNDSGYKWYSEDGVHCKGYLFDENNQLYEGRNLINYFSSIKDINDFELNLKEANGFFAVVINKDDKLYAAVDRVRSIPLFYNENSNFFIISDNANYIKNELQLSSEDINEVNKKEFLVTGYVTGNQTLFNNVKQIQAGELIHSNKNNYKVDHKRYFKFLHKNYDNSNSKKLIEKLDQIHLNIFNRLIKYLGSRTAVIPLSGGYDSRLIVEMLHRLDYKKVICFSYGKKNNIESKISKKVAEELGYQWIFIEHKRKDWHSFHNSKERKKYYQFGRNLTSLAHIQDFMAVKKLKNNNIIPKNSVFIPGHTGDFISGGHIPNIIYDNKNLSLDQLINTIFNKHYNLWDLKNKSRLKNNFKLKLIKQIKSLKKSDYTAEKAASLFELFDWQERQAKFIVNSLRVYDYFDYKWSLPLWDKELIRFWQKNSLKFRYNRNLYKKYVEQKSGIQVQANPKKNKLIKYWERFNQIRYARYTKKSNIFSILTSKIGDINNLKNIDFINNNDYIISKNINSLNVLIHLNDVYKNVNHNLDHL